MKNILVVDDQDNIRRLIEISLGAENRQIFGVNSGEKAIDFVQDIALDLIILDLVMPGGMDGLKALEILKANSKTRDCPVLMLTARNHQTDRDHAYRLGARDYLTKPFPIQVLQQRVKDILA
ncbi:MAG: response regulator [Trichloromonadaceae bacterium]